MSAKKPITNCHTHTFIGDDVPSFLAKTFIIWPLYYLFSVKAILRVCRFIYLSKYSPLVFTKKPWFSLPRRWFYQIRMLGPRWEIVLALKVVINLIITLNALFCIYEWYTNENWYKIELISKYCSICETVFKNLIFLPETVSEYIVLKILLVAFTFLFIKVGRTFIMFLLRSLIIPLKYLPSKKSLSFLERYVNIGRFAYYKRQKEVFRKLHEQYPNGSRFVILSMDMEFMKAGKSKRPFRNQIEELAKLKKQFPNTVFPFLFIDPRRYEKEGKAFFDYKMEGNKMVLKDCFVKSCMEVNKFSGFKIYPALGYYVFDEMLLPIWYYAVQNNIPITTHAIRGNIFYRGPKKRDWDYHPIFRQRKPNTVDRCFHDENKICKMNGAMCTEFEHKKCTLNHQSVQQYSYKENYSLDDQYYERNYEPLLLPEVKNIDFINNFTHPLNYACLLYDRLFAIVLDKVQDPKIKSLFTDVNGKLIFSLRDLKICFGHYGGEDEWNKYFEKDRDNFSRNIVGKEYCGINLFYKLRGGFSHSNLEQLWKYGDWYSIITSMMLQKKNVFADISYILHETSITPLLKRTLSNAKLKTRVLYGTDFYVVRNHKSEKQMLAEFQALLSEEEFDQIARINPDEFI